MAKRPTTKTPAKKSGAAKPAPAKAARGPKVAAAKFANATKPAVAKKAAPATRPAPATKSGAAPATKPSTPAKKKPAAKKPAGAPAKEPAAALAKQPAALAKRPPAQKPPAQKPPAPVVITSAAPSPTGPRLTLGVDEAGRGPALGPMVIACVALDSAAARRLTRAGLADSKSYGAGAQAHARRLELAAEIRACAIHVALEVVPVEVIDARVMRSELNALEREVARRLIAGAPGCHRVIADGRRMFAQLAAEFAGFESHDDGESVHAAVAAASVIAKTHRDELWHAIRDRYAADFGEVTGGGYVNDGTRAFVRAYVTRHGDLPPEARRSWPHPYVADLLPSLRNEGAQLSLF